MYCYRKKMPKLQLLLYLFHATRKGAVLCGYTLFACDLNLIRRMESLTRLYLFQNIASY